LVPSRDWQATLYVTWPAEGRRLGLAARGGTTTELKAKFGWKSSSEADLYTEAADRENAARSAAEKLKRSEHQWANSARSLPKTRISH